MCKIPKLLFTSENVHKLCTKYSNIYIKSQKMINFLHKRHYGKFSKYVEKISEKFRKFGEKIYKFPFYVSSPQTPCSRNSAELQNQQS